MRGPYILLSESADLHNCTKCCQCLPGFYQQECTPSDGKTCSEVLLGVPCAGRLGNQRLPCRGPGGPVVNELICDRRGVGQASAPKGPVSDRQAAGQASALPWATGEAEREPVCDQHGVDQASPASSRKRNSFQSVAVGPRQPERIRALVPVRASLITRQGPVQPKVRRRTWRWPAAAARAASLSLLPNRRPWFCLHSTVS